MAGKNENISELNRRNMEAAMRLAQMSIENSQRVMALQNELARELFQQGVENARNLTSAKDPQQLMQLRTQYAQETAQQMMVAAQKVTEIGNEARAEFTRMLTEQLASGNQEMVDAFQGFFKSMPGPNTNFLEIMQQSMATANSAFEKIAQASAAAFGGMPSPAPKSTAKKK